MTIEIRAVRDLVEFSGAIGAIGHYFGGWPKEQADAERFAANLPFERTHAAFEDAVVVGAAAAFPFELTIPGGTLGCAGVTVVGVLPTHRRRGLMRRLMREQLDDVRRRGEPLAALWASEEGIYRRFGYGMAAVGTELALPKGHHELRVPRDESVTMRLVTLEEAKTLVPPIYDRVRLRTPGMYARPSAWWETRQLLDRPESREDGAVKNVVVAERDGTPVAYALYRVVTKFEGSGNLGHVRVLEALGDDDAEVELWRYLLGIDWISTYRAEHLAIDHPLLHALVNPRRAELRLYDTLFVRLVDVGAALSARSWATDDALVLEIADTFLPENAGRWRVGAGAGERTDAAPDLALDVNELASLYLGGFGASELLRARLVRELTTGAAVRADALFATARKPSCPEVF